MEISKPPDNPNMPASVLHTESTILEVSNIEYESVLVIVLEYN